jgi:hypothetical protein
MVYRLYYTIYFPIKLIINNLILLCLIFNPVFHIFFKIIISQDLITQHHLLFFISLSFIIHYFIIHYFIIKFIIIKFIILIFHIFILIFNFFIIQFLIKYSYF